MRIAGSSLLYSRSSLPAACHAVAALGFEAIDLATAEGWAHVDPSTMVGAVDDTVARMRDACEDANIEPVAFNAILGNADLEEQVSRIRALAAVAESLEVGVACLAPGGTDESLEDDIERVDRLVEAIDGYPLTLAIEAHYGMLTEDPAVALQYVEAVDGVAITLDPSQFAGGPYWADGDGFDPLLSHTAHVHLRQATPGNLQALDGSGIIDVEDVIEKLLSVDYDGVLSVEYIDSYEDPDPELIETHARRMREELADLV